MSTEKTSEANSEKLTDRDYELLEKAALVLFQVDCPRLFAEGGGKVSMRCFSWAWEFMLLAKNIRGGFIPVKPKPPAPKMMPVIYFDPETNEQIERIEEELDYCLPNADPMHPVNQRCQNFTGPNNTDVGH